MYADLKDKEKEAVDAGLRLFMQLVSSQGYLTSGDSRFIKVRENLAEYFMECNPESFDEDISITIKMTPQGRLK